MKPILHIIGVGNSHLGKLPLDIYRLLKNVKTIYILHTEHPAVQEMIKENLPCRNLS